jgi:hypothetical protein
MSGAGLARSPSTTIVLPSTLCSIKGASPARSRIVSVLALAETTARRRPASLAVSR